MRRILRTIFAKTEYRYSACVPQLSNIVVKEDSRPPLVAISCDAAKNENKELDLIQNFEPLPWFSYGAKKVSKM